MAATYARLGLSGDPPHQRYRAPSILMASEIRTSGALLGDPSPRMHARTQSFTSSASVSVHACPRRRCSCFASPRYDPTVRYLAARRHAAPQRILKGVSG